MRSANHSFRRITVLLLLFVLAFPFHPVLAQTRIKAPRNFFSIENDVEFGREAAAEYGRQLKPLDDEEVSWYVERVGTRLTRSIPENFQRRQFRYRFLTVDSKEVNAFALPGGHVFVNRGLLEMARNEGELAGVLAHEISHVALRHGTAQASKALLMQVGLAVLGEVLDGGRKAEWAQLGAAVGLGVYLLKFSRDYEKQADILGAQIMSRAGYDPHDLAAILGRLGETGGTSRGPQWLSSHPNPPNRAARINQEAMLLTVSHSATEEWSEFARIQERLRLMPDSRSLELRVRESLQALDN